jgi:hypothetical protein
VHFLFVRIPTPATIRIYCDVGKGIELELLKTFESSARAPVANISMPKMEYIDVEIHGLGLHCFIKRFGPSDISILLALVHVVIFHIFITATVCRRSHRPITATENASVKKPVLVQNLAARSPRKAARTVAFADV